MANIKVLLLLCFIFIAVAANAAPMGKLIVNFDNQICNKQNYQSSIVVGENYFMITLYVPKKISTPKAKTKTLLFKFWNADNEIQRHC